MIAISHSIMRIGTRGSKLAIAQAREVERRLTRGNRHLRCDLVTITTAGDRDLSRPIREIGGKGIFCRDIETALLTDIIDIAVHSYKDMPVEQPSGLVIDCMLERADPRDALISHKARSVQDLPDGSVIGTSSLRRRAQILALNPRLSVVDIRGNLDTRLRKLVDGTVDALVLAMAGLARLDRVSAAVTAIPVKDMLPAAAQGVICVERRADDEGAKEHLARLHHQATHIATRAERACLAKLDGSCRTPIAAYARATNGSVTLEGAVFAPDGSMARRADGSAAAEDAADLGRRIGSRLIEPG